MLDSDPLAAEARHQSNQADNLASAMRAEITAKAEFDNYMANYPHNAREAAWHAEYLMDQLMDARERVGELDPEWGGQPPQEAADDRQEQGDAEEHSESREGRHQDLSGVKQVDGEAVVPTDAELLAAIDRGVASGDYVVVDDKYLAELSAISDDTTDLAGGETGGDKEAAPADLSWSEQVSAEAGLMQEQYSPDAPSGTVHVGYNEEAASQQEAIERMEAAGEYDAYDTTADPERRGALAGDAQRRDDDSSYQHAELSWSEQVQAEAALMREQYLTDHQAATGDDASDFISVEDFIGDAVDRVGQDPDSVAEIPPAAVDPFGSQRTVDRWETASEVDRDAMEDDGEAPDASDFEAVEDTSAARESSEAEWQPASPEELKAIDAKYVGREITDDEFSQWRGERYVATGGESENSWWRHDEARAVDDSGGSTAGGSDVEQERDAAAVDQVEEVEEDLPDYLTPEQTFDWIDKHIDPYTDNYDFESVDDGGTSSAAGDEATERRSGEAIDQAGSSDGGSTELDDRDELDDEADDASYEAAEERAAKAVDEACGAVDRSTAADSGRYSEASTDTGDRRGDDDSW